MSAVDTERYGGIVLGGDYQGLGIVRSLGRRGIPVCVVDDELSISRFSRYARQAVRVANLRDEERTVTCLLALGRKYDLDGWVLYPTREELVAALARRREALSQTFRVPTPRWEQVRWAWDKRETHRLTRRLGLPAARTWWPGDVDELRALPAEPPLIVKPAIKEHFLYATGAKAWRANTRCELEQLFRRAATLLPPGETMVQELIPSGGQQRFAYCAFFKDGRPLASMTVRRLRQHPPEFGRASTLVETVDEPRVEELALAFLRAMDYYGLVELEYAFDARDGQFKLLDVNARTWGYHSLGARAGVDFPYLLHADQLGHETRPRRARVGVRWVRMLTDAPAAAVEMWQRRLGLRGYLRSLRGTRVEAVFSARDPLPGLAELALVPYLIVKRGF